MREKHQYSGSTESTEMLYLVNFAKRDDEKHVGNTALPMATHPKVMGLTLHPKLKYSTHIHNISVYSHKPLQMIKTLTSTGWGKQKEGLMAAYKAVMRPAVEYASSIWTPPVKQPAVKKQCQSQLKRANNRRLKVLYCNADTFTQEKKHELQVLMAEDQPDIVALTEVNPMGRCYKIEDIKIRGYITFESNLSCVGRRAVAVLVHSSLE